MKAPIINQNAESFAEKVCGTVMPYRGLSFVLYNYGSSPSLACWEGRQKRPIKNLHFLYQTARADYIQNLKSEQDSHHRFRFYLRMLRKKERMTALN